MGISLRQSEVLQTALCTVQQWSERTKLFINPNKTVVIPFTKKRHIQGLREPILFSKRIQLSSEVKYLGVTLDKGLNGKSSWIKSLIKPTRPSGHAEAHLEKLGD
jgi:hypothetical protein